MATMESREVVELVCTPSSTRLLKKILTNYRVVWMDEVNLRNNTDQEWRQMVRVMLEAGSGHVECVGVHTAPEELVANCNTTYFTAMAAIVSGFEIGVEFDENNRKVRIWYGERLELEDIDDCVDFFMREGEINHYNEDDEGDQDDEGNLFHSSLFD